MTPLARIAGFGALLLVIFAGAAWAGSQLDPGVDEDAGEHKEGLETMKDHSNATLAEAEAALPGLAVAAHGYRLVPEETALQRGSERRYGFRIVDGAGATVEEFDLEHERRMHLIIVRRDFAGFQHLHPRQRPDGGWEVAVDLREAGAYRVFADFATDGESMTLGAELFVPGQFDPVPLPGVSRTAAAGDGYEVTAADAEPGAVEFTVTRNGREVGAVQSYLGADGHLVALREHDQAFLHTHPEGDPGGPGPIVFRVEYPTAGRYRLFLQFKHRGEVRTAAFTREVSESGAGVAEGGHDD